MDEDIASVIDSPDFALQSFLSNVVKQNKSSKNKFLHLQNNLGGGACNHLINILLMQRKHMRK
jgi:hypothetical protein